MEANFKVYWFAEDYAQLLNSPFMQLFAHEALNGNFDGYLMLLSRMLSSCQVPFGGVGMARALVNFQPASHANAKCPSNDSLANSSLSN